MAGVHVQDYLGVLRNHWFAVGVVFLLVFGWLLSRSLLATPTYETSATIQVDSQRGAGGGMLAELAPLERPSVTEAEIAVLLSYTLALEAARTGGQWAQIEEVNAYRPLEVLLRSLRGGWITLPPRREDGAGHGEQGSSRGRCDSTPTGAA